MAHPTRGHRSGTYEITQLIGVNRDDLSITVRHAGAFQPQTVRLDVLHTPAAAQILDSMAASIKVGDHGDADAAWESFVTLRNSLFYVRIILERLVEVGIEDFSDTRVDVALLRSLYDPLHPNTKRSACHLLCRVVRENHPNGRALATALGNSRFIVLESQTFAYDDAVAEAIEASARAVYTARYTEARELFGSLGFDVAGRGWLRLTADDLVRWAQEQRPDVCDPRARQPSAAADTATCAAWAITHPRELGRVKGKRAQQARHPQMARMQRVFYPDHVFLVSALILHCLGENSGYNHSVLLQKSAASLTRIGPDHALEHNVKARNATQDTRPTQTSSIYAPGGIVEVLTGMTRMARHARRGLVGTDGKVMPIADRLYVEHTADPRDAALLASDRQHNGWRNMEFDEGWDEAAAGPRSDAPLRMAALRLVAQRRAMGEGLTADVHGHSDAVKTHYSAHVLPDHVFNAHAVAAQDSFHEEAVAKFTLVADATDGPAAELASVDPAEVMDVEVGLCTSGGTAPDGSGRRCDLGIVACFTCPNGYRTVDHVPGLIAAVELADIIERNDPEEWVEGQASRLRYYASACLRQFPPAVVETVKRTSDIPAHILTVTGVYMEMRHG